METRIRFVSTREDSKNLFEVLRLGSARHRSENFHQGLRRYPDQTMQRSAPARMPRRTVRGDVDNARYPMLPTRRQLGAPAWNGSQLAVAGILKVEEISACIESEGHHPACQRIDCQQCRQTAGGAPRLIGDWGQGYRPSRHHRPRGFSEADFSRLVTEVTGSKGEFDESIFQ